MKKLVFLLLVTFSLSTVAQEKLTEGIITSKMTMSSDNEQMKATFDMMGDMQIVTYFKDKKARAEMDNPMSGKTVTIIDQEDKTMLMLLNNPMMGKIYKLSKVEDTPDASGVKIVKGDETKTISGYECQEYNVEVTQDGQKVTMDMYVTDQIEAPNQQTAEFGADVKGFPMLMTVSINQQGMDMKMVYEVTDIKKESVSDDKFSMTPPEGYKEMEGM